MMKPIILGFALLIAGNVLGQEPVLSGYLGKLNYASLKYNTGVRLSHPEQWKPFSEVSSRNYSGVSAKSELEINVGRVFSNRFVLEGIFGHNSLSMDLDHGGSAFYHQSNTGFQRSYDYYLGYPKITDLYTGVSAKFYRRNKGALAPIGVYYGLKLNFHTYSINLNDIIAGYYTGTLNGEEQDLFDFGTFKFKFVEYSGTIGQTRAIADNVILDYGFSMGWGFTGSNFYDPRIPSESEFKSEFLEMIKAYQVGKVHISIGYMF